MICHLDVAFLLLVVLVYFMLFGCTSNIIVMVIIN